MALLDYAARHAGRSSVCNIGAVPKHLAGLGVARQRIVEPAHSLTNDRQQIECFNVTDALNIGVVARLDLAKPLFLSARGSARAWAKS